MCLVVNQFATPGLGSILAGRVLAGVVQLVLACAGFALLLAAFTRLMRGVFDAEPLGELLAAHRTLWGSGLGLFGLGWLLALFTSLSVVRAARDRPPSSPPPLPPPA